MPKPYDPTKVPMPAARLHAGMRLVTSAFERHQVIDYGDARAREVEEDLLTTIEEVNSLLWKPQPQCCGNSVVGAEYMGSVEMVCCGEPELDSLSDAEIVKRLREMFPNPEGKTT